MWRADRGRPATEGETVLDLGSGAGADVLISARRVGPTGKAIGLDMTDEMLELARANALTAGVENVEFRKGYHEDMPLGDETVDVVISNCVINLSGDKAQVIREAARVLRPGGRFAVSDVIADPGMDEQTRADVAAWTGCIAGALTETEFRSLLEGAGFTEIEITETIACTSTPGRPSSAPTSLARRRPPAQVADRTQLAGRATGSPVRSGSSGPESGSPSASLLEASGGWPAFEGFARLAGSRPARRTRSASRYSIWALTLRRSSSAHRRSASNRRGSMRSRNRLGAAITVSRVERCDIDDGPGRAIAAEDDQQVRGHRGLALGVELHEIGRFQLRHRHPR